ncbi:HAD-IA family hydrolase [Leucothrix arctica]|uniref:Glycosyl transferase family 1 domain-containing protein n=1 Tax=Leucothrix arctica TaxID=1481894 RepID=A0A317CJE7_9GAMM|nr:HAD-IA family hydrolase [Leucothrix arctica]PWQ98684.1 hypothetical protein DKT75_02415 [Leucothrix arctica]
MLKKLKKFIKKQSGTTEHSHLKLIETTDLFDENYYLIQYPDLQRTGLNYAKHYLKKGWKEGRNPSQAFNTNSYLNANPDVKNRGMNPLLHYILFGQYEGRTLTHKTNSPTHLSQTPPSPALQPNKWLNETTDTAQTYRLLKDSQLFSDSYYIQHYSDIQQDPIEHYVLYGAKEGRNPSHEFNTLHYLEKNPDVAASGMNPLEHFIRFGQGEGRKARVKYVNPCAHQLTNSPSLIFVSHEASETGAPAVLLSLMNWLKEHTDINFSIVVGAAGPWDAKFEAIAPTFFMDRPHTGDDIADFCGDHVQTIYINTIAAASYAKAFEFLHAEFVTHVHEMENVFQIFEHNVAILKDICQKYIAVSPGSVESLNKRFADIDLQYLKPFINRYSQTEKTTHPCESKKLIFGCGAVEKRKGFDLFCKVAQQLKQNKTLNIEMHWIGSDQNKDLNAANTIAEFDVEDIVKFIGPKGNPRDYFIHGDLFLLTSREDPYPLVCMEAAEQRLPVICFDEQAGGMHTFVETDAGRVVKYLDANAMTAAAVELLTNEELSRSMGSAAKQKVIERHYVDVIAPQILDFLPASATVGQLDKIENYKALIDNADIVSFDIFDTLVTREMAQPETVFDIAEYQHTAQEAGILSLFEERMKTAGKVLGSKQGRVDDISIDEIYQHMPLYRNSQIEKRAEIDTCIEHPTGKTLYRHALKQGKKIFITSDMYLDRDTVEQILKTNGYNKWNEFFLSSERGRKKDTGKLFKDVIEAALQIGIKADKIIHIGDNWIGDVKCARQAGLNAVRFSPIYESDSKMIQLSPKQQQSLSQMGRIWESFNIQATRLWAQANPQLANDFYTKLGFELTGPLTTMMAMHTKNIADEQGIKKIVFMARDGRIIKKAFDTLYKSQIEQGQYQSQYLHLSRATVVGATLEEQLSSNDLYFLIEGLHLAEKPISYFLKKAKLSPDDSFIKTKVEAIFKSVDYVPNWNDFSKLSDMLESLSTEIYHANSAQRDGLALYLKEHGALDAKKVLVVDVGWLINIQSRLDRFVKSLNPSTKIIGAYVGTRERVNKSLTHSSLLYNMGEPTLYSRFLEDNVTLFEVLFSSPEPSAAAITAINGKAELELKELGSPLPKEYIVAQKLQMGAESYFDRLVQSVNSHLPLSISTDYFYSIFEALVKTNNDIAKVELGNFEVRLGGHHEFVAYQSLIATEPNIDYAYTPHNEYFEPISYFADKENENIDSLIITSAGLDNGSTRYRALHLAESLQYQGKNAVVIHSQTSLETAKVLIQRSQRIVFQRVFAEQGNIGKFLALARQYEKYCVGEMDDLIFPEHIAEVGSVKGGEWDLDQAMFVATAYESFMLKLDSMIVSTPALKSHIEEKYQINCQVIPNKVSAKDIRKPVPKSGPLRLLYSSGTYSHREDFQMIEQELFDYLNDTPSVTLSILGATQSSERILSLSNVSCYPLLAYSAMLEFIAKHDLMLVPLANDVFNNAKSNVKFVEAGAVGVPVLASNVREFASCIDHGVNGYLFDKSISEILISLDNNKINKIHSDLHTAIKEKFNTKIITQ